MRKRFNACMADFLPRRRPRPIGSFSIRWGEQVLAGRHQNSHALPVKV
jgi:hypothetical protein